MRIVQKGHLFVVKDNYVARYKSYLCNVEKY